MHGGAETQVIALSRELASRGHAVIVYTLHPDNPRADELRGSGVNVVADCKRAKFDPRLVLRIRNTIREFNADVVHGFLLEGNLYARLAVARTRVPALNSERNHNYRIPLPHRLALTLTRHMAAGIVANTHAGAAFARQIFGLPEEQVHVVWNGINPVSRARSLKTSSHIKSEVFGSSPGIKVASVVGMFRPQKDHVLALEVAEALIQKDPSWRVLFVGDALPHTMKYKEHVTNVRDRRCLADVVKFTGVRRDVLSVISQSDVLLSTSLHEGFPNVVIEAMSVGTPVVSTDYSDIRQILPCEWQVVGSRNPAELAAAVVRASNRRESVAKLQDEWLRKNATLDLEVDRLEAVYRKYVAA
jgi:glycosyltransferase involved in cell wall biosynthesis